MLLPRLQVDPPKTLLERLWYILNTNVFVLILYPFIEDIHKRTRNDELIEALLTDLEFSQELLDFLLRRADPQTLIDAQKYMEKREFDSLMKKSYSTPETKPERPQIQNEEPPSTN